MSFFTDAHTSLIVLQALEILSTLTMISSPYNSTRVIDVGHHIIVSIVLGNQAHGLTLLHPLIHLPNSNSFFLTHRNERKETKAGSHSFSRFFLKNKNKETNL